MRTTAATPPPPPHNLCLRTHLIPGSAHLPPPLTPPCYSVVYRYHRSRWGVLDGWRRYRCHTTTWATTLCSTAYLPFTRCLLFCCHLPLPVLHLPPHSPVMTTMIATTYCYTYLYTCHHVLLPLPLFCHRYLPPAWCCDSPFYLPTCRYHRITVIVILCCFSPATGLFLLNFRIVLLGDDSGGDLPTYRHSSTRHAFCCIVFYCTTCSLMMGRDHSRFYFL